MTESAVDNNNSSGSDEEVQDAQKNTINERVIYQAALQDLKQPKTERDLPPGVLSVPLMRHQKIALEWMRKKEKRKLHCLGGILADDQGLGKTISTIALILFQKLKSQAKLRKPRSRKSGGTLIVCPASVVKQWARELDEKVSNEHKLSVLVYHGSNRTEDPTELAKHDVVVTTYAIVTNEVPQNPLLDYYDETRSKKRGRESNRKCCDSGPLARVKWLRVVLDEAQTIKNRKTQVAKACFSLRAKRRWCLSGTPIQNKIDDLYSYFRFLRYHPYAMYSSFCRTIKGPLSKNSLNGYKKLQAVLRAIMLRRTKGTLLDGKPIINLPPKEVNLSKVEFSVEEWSFYRKLEILSQLEFEEYAAEDSLNQNYALMLVMLLRLRQACNHPQLLREYIDSDDFRGLTKEAVRNVPRESLISLFNLLKSSSTICPVCSLSTPEDPVVTLCGHVFCFECVSETINGDEKTCPVPTCRAELAPYSVFSESKLRSCIKDYDDHYGKTALRVVLQSEFVSSKIKAVIDILKSHSKQDGPESPAIKTIVFSQWNGMLDLVEHCFVKNRIEFRRLDGTMSLLTRDRAVKEFNNDPNVQVMLMSLKAGNLGLNMVSACHVILLDLWWNPTTEDQAIDRAHRIGQTRTVTVTRITTKNTVEDRILALQESKRTMVASAMGENHGKSSAIQLTIEDLEYLFFGV